MGYYDTKSELVSLLGQIEKAKEQLETELNELEKVRTKAKKDKEAVNQLAKERQIGFPTLAKAYEDFYALQDKQLIDLLQFKDKPAVRASEIIAEYARLKRKSDKENKILRYIIDYYESIAPFLVDLKEELEDIEEDDRSLLADYTEEELEDQATNYLSKEEFRKLPTAEKNQLALDRYWKRPKSKWHIGKIYERYVGYTYETQGYDVEFVGIFKGLEDLGRDIIATNGKDLIVIQCKNWSQFRTIYEKHIFQFFGTVFQYKDENKDKNVKAIFYTTTKLSDLARRFAKELGINLEEGFRMDQSYPCIKCNIAQDGTKIYHLPFDQQYDKVKIKPKLGEFYCHTVKEAEEKGFRRAFRYKGLAKS